MHIDFDPAHLAGSYYGRRKDVTETMEKVEGQIRELKEKRDEMNLEHQKRWKGNWLRYLFSKKGPWRWNQYYIVLRMSHKGYLRLSLGDLLFPGDAWSEDYGVNLPFVFKKVPDK
jgi:hypothetical protein